MAIKQKPFKKYKLEEEKDKDDKTFTTRLTPEDREWFRPAKNFLKQPKNSTCMKQLARIGATVVLHDKKMNTIIDIVVGNTRRNKKLGVPDSEHEKV